MEIANYNRMWKYLFTHCIAGGFTPFGNTDAHDYVEWIYRMPANANSVRYRNMTLVLAKECTEKAIREALEKRRTIGYSSNNLIGEEMWLEEFLNAAVDCKVVSVNEGNRVFQLTNTCSIPFILRRGSAEYILNPFQSQRISVGRNKETKKYYEPEFTIENMWTVGDKQPKFVIEIDK